MKERRSEIALLTVALGFWLIAITFTFPYFSVPFKISDMATGVLFVLFGLLALSKKWPSVAIGLLGVWLQLSPLLFWAPSSLTYVNNTLVGAIAIVFSFLLAAKSSKLKSTEEYPHGWSFNPSSWNTRIPTIALAMVCWSFARYMAAYQLGYIDTIWDPFFPDGTLRVITSDVSKAFPISDAGLGAFGYTFEALLGWQGDNRRWANMPWLVVIFGVLVVPVSVVSITLIILQPLVVGAWCSWCLATALVMLVMIVLTAAEFAAVIQFLIEAKRRRESVWHIFWKGGVERGGEKSVKPKVPRRTRQGWGITMPWNLATATILGILLMAIPDGPFDYIIGPIVVSVSVIAFAEAFRAVRFVLIPLGCWLIAAPWLVPNSSLLSMALHILAGVAAIALCIRKGVVRERYGMWERWIV